MSQKAAKMCKSPKNLLLTDQVIEYEHLNTNCTVVGSNNLHLVKKPQTLVTTHNVSPVYSNPSPGPYGSPASMKSPSPQLLKPPTPQPTFPVMQIINPVITTRSLHQPQQANIIKLKPPLNILPKPSSSPQQTRQSPKPPPSPQLQVPHQATLVQQPLLLNQMPMLTAPGVRFILQPQTAKISPQVQQTPQGLILQPAAGQQLLHLQPPRSQPMVRVLTNGVGIPATTYVTQMAPAQNSTSSQLQTSTVSPKKKAPVKKKKQRLDLANIMKLSGIGDEDDIMFESDASQSESDASTTSQPLQVSQTQQQQQIQMEKKVITAQPSIIQQLQQQSQTSAPIVQVLNQAFQQGSQQASISQQSIPFSPFSIAAPNFAIGTNGGLMVQRSGGFKLAFGEDGRLVLQHDPTLNQDLQSQLLLQSIFGMNGGCGSLVLQPSIDQQIHSQTVQTIQQQSVQTIQQQTVQSQTIQTVQHQIVQPPTIQSIQSQIQGQIQSLLQQQNISLQQPNINNISLSQPNIIQGLITSQAQQQQSQHAQQIVHNNQVIGQKLTPASVAQSVVSTAGAPTTSSAIVSSIANNAPLFSNTVHSLPSSQTTALTGQQPVLKVQPFQKSQPPVQTVHPIHHQNNQASTLPPQPQHPPSGGGPTSYVVNLTPDQLEQLKRNGQLTVNGQTIFMQRPNKESIHSEKKTSPKIKPLKKALGKIMVGKDQSIVTTTATSSASGANNLDKIINSVAGAGAGKVVKQSHLAAIIQPSVQVAPVKFNVQNQMQNQHPQANLQCQKIVTTAAKLFVSPAACTSSTVVPMPSVISTTSIAATIQSIRPTPSVVTSSGVVIGSIPSSITPISSILSLSPANAQTTRPVSISSTEVVPSSTSPAVVSKTRDCDVQKLLGNFMDESSPKSMPNKIQNTLQQTPTQLNQVQIQHLHPNQLNSNGIPSGASTMIQQQSPNPSKIVAVPNKAKIVVSAKSHEIVDQQSQTSHSQIIISQPQSQQQPQQKVLMRAPISPATNQQQHAPSMIVTSSSGMVLPQIPNNSNQRIHTIQLTPQKQQHLKSIQLQIQTLSARMQPGNEEMQNTLKLLFQEQQKILASGKLLSPDKVFYHGNQIIVNNSTISKNEVLPSPNKTCRPSPISQTTPENTKQVQLIQPKTESATCVVPPSPSTACSSSSLTTSVSSCLKPRETETKINKIPLHTRAQLIEQQMNTDQNGAIKPDIETPFRDKGDACKRLIRYHCFEQPVLSEKDLDKADEIFELTAKHFIDKFGRMVDKYRYLLHKESQRQVPTSELMMLDRMFLNEEQQSIMKLRQEIDEYNMEMQMQDHVRQTPSSDQKEVANSEDYDEWTCIQRELNCISENSENAGPCNQYSNQAISRGQTTINNSTEKTNDSSECPNLTSTCNFIPTTTTIATMHSANQQHASHSTGGKRPTSASAFFNADKPETKKLRIEKTLSLKSTSFNVTNENGLQSAEATRFILKSSSLNLNGDGSEVSSQQNLLQQHQQHNQRMPVHSSNQHHNATVTSTSGSYSIQQQRFNMQQYTTHNSQHIVHHVTHTMQNQIGVQQQQQNYQQQMNVNSYNCSMSTLSSSCSSTSTRSNNEENDSIDEQVQSAIDSILNLQQNNLEMDETMQNMLS